MLDFPTVLLQARQAAHLPNAVPTVRMIKERARQATMIGSHVTYEDFNKLAKGNLMNDLADVLAEQSVRLMGLGRSQMFYLSSHMSCSVPEGYYLPDDWNSPTVKRLCRKLKDVDGMEVCGILHHGVHWVAYLVEHSSLCGLVKITVVDSGLPKVPPYSGVLRFNWHGGWNVLRQPPRVVSINAPSYIGQLKTIAAFYCTTYQLADGTPVEVEVQGTGQQLERDATFPNYSDGWSCGRWALCNLTHLLATAHGLHCARVAQNTTLHLAELVFCTMGPTDIVIDNDSGSEPEITGESFRRGRGGRAGRVIK